jgi:hypothetical protein
VRTFTINEITEILGGSESLLSQWYSEGIIELDQKPKEKGTKANFSLHSLVQILVIDRLVKSGISLSVASKISQDYLSACETIEWDLREEATYLWINLDDSDDWLMLPDYEFESLGFAPDSKKSYLIIALNPVYMQVSKLISEWDRLKASIP